MSGDPRAGRVAVVADELLESTLGELRAGNWGVIQLPPAEIGGEPAREWLALAAEQIAEYQRTGYELQLVDDGRWREPLAAALARVGARPL
jgi:hypothetical protein